MSAPASAAHTEPSKLYTYVWIAMTLSVITGLEIMCIFMRLPHGVIFGVLALLSAVKFMFVIFYFMHLKWDKVFCTILFFIGLGLAGLIMWAVLGLFGAEASKPLSAAALDFARQAIV